MGDGPAVRAQAPADLREALAGMVRQAIHDLAPRGVVEEVLGQGFRAPGHGEKLGGGFRQELENSV